MANEKVVTWSFFAVAMSMLALAIFTAIINPSSSSVGGGKGYLLIQVAASLGLFIKPIFGVYSK